MCLLIEISQEFVSKDVIYNKSTMVQVMAWCLTSAKPLSEAVVIQHIA